MFLHAREFEFTFPRPALVMGIVNVTPDSFSDAGKFFDADAAVEHGLKLAGQGAEILDVGGESTRPNAVPVSEVGEFFFERLERMSDCGLSREQIILDVGIGFGKTVEHNLRLLGALESFQKHGRPLLIGASRKSFTGKLAGAELSDRLAASLACACLAVEAGAQIIRAHDVAETVQAIRM